MTIAQKIRKIWHDIFYNKASAEKVEFAMRCRDVAHQVDFHAEDLSLKDKFRFHLHLSLCQACHNYYVISRFLSEKIKGISKPNVTEVKLAQLNQRLLETHERKIK